jgi:hypothetical protein
VSRPAWAGKRRDETEREIVDALELVGAKVERLDRPCDLLVRFRGLVHVLEVDGITKNRKREAGQLRFLHEWQVPLVKTPLDALRAIGASRIP